MPVFILDLFETAAELFREEVTDIEIDWEETRSQVLSDCGYSFMNRKGAARV